MTYAYDIFVSYKRHRESRGWLVEHFQPLLEYYVEQELGRPPVVFRDDQDTDAGSTWPVEIGQALGNSRVLVALWTKTYFHSKWCTAELSSMLAREQDEGFRTVNNADGLIVPVVLHDCEQLPPPIAPIQYTPLKECFNIRLRKDSPLAETLAKVVMTEIAPGVAKAIEHAPPWRAQWPLTAAQQLLDAIVRPGAPQQSTVPRIGR